MKNQDEFSVMATTFFVVSLFYICYDSMLYPAAWQLQLQQSNKFKVGFKCIHKWMIINTFYILCG